MMNDTDSISIDCTFYIHFTREGYFNSIKKLTPEQAKYAKKNSTMYIFPCSGQLLKNLQGIEKRFLKALNVFSKEFVKEI